MKNKKYTGFIIIGILVVLGIYLISTYNSLVKKEEKVNLQANEVQNAYQRRMDLIPTLINTVKGVAGFEQNVLTEIASARSKAQSVNIDSACWIPQPCRTRHTGAWSSGGCGTYPCKCRECRGTGLDFPSVNSYRFFGLSRTM